MLRMSLGASLSMILALVRRWAFAICEDLVKFFGTDLSALRSSQKCYALIIYAPGPELAEWGDGDGAWVQPKQFGS